MKNNRSLTYLVTGLLILTAVLSLLPARSLSAIESVQRWKIKMDDFINAAPVIGDVTGDGVYDIVIGDQKGFVRIYNSQTGKKISEINLKDKINASPVIDDFRGLNLFDILVCTAHGNIYLYDPRTQKELWKVKVLNNIQTTPAVSMLSKGKYYMYVTDDDTNVYCYEVGQDKPRWMKKIGIPILTSPALTDTNRDGVTDVFLGCSDGKIYVLDGKSGDNLSKFTLSKDRISSQPVITDFNKDGNVEIVAGSEDQKIYSFSFNNPVPVWTPYKTNGKIKVAFAINSFGQDKVIKVVCPSEDNNCYIIEPMNGNILGTAPLESSPSSPPIWVTLNNDKKEDILIGTESGKVYHVDGSTFAVNPVADIGESVFSVLAGDIPNEGQMNLLVSSQNVMALYNLKSPTDFGTLYWPTVYGNPQRNGHPDSKYLVHLYTIKQAHQQEIDKLFQLGLDLKKSKQYDKAMEKFQQVMTLNSNHADALQQISSLNFNKKKPLILKITGGLLLIISIIAGFFLNLRYQKSKIGKARELLENNQLDEALSKYRKVIHMSKTELLPTLALAYSHKGIIDDPEAIEVYEDAITVRPFIEKPTMVHYLLAKAYCHQARYDARSETVYETALKFKPNDLEIMKAFSNTYLALNKIDRMIEINEYLMKNNLQDNQVVINLAKGYLSKNRIDNTVFPIYLNAVEANPSDNDFIKNVARLFVLGDMVNTQSVKIIESANYLDPANRIFIIGIAKYKADKGKFQEAIDMANQLLSSQADDWESLGILGHCYVELKQFDLAVEHLKKAIQLNPSDKHLTSYLAIAYAGAQKSTDEALHTITQAIAKDPNSSELHEAMARTYIARKDTINAITALRNWEHISPAQIEYIIDQYKELLKQVPNDHNVLVQLFSLSLKIKQFTDAMTYLNQLEKLYANDLNFTLRLYQEYLQYDSKSLDVLTRRSKILLRTGKVDEAISDVEKAYELAPNSQSIYDLSESIYLEKIKREPENLSFRFKLGVLQFKMGDADHAVDHLQKCMTEKYREQETSKYLALCLIKKGMLDLAYRRLKDLPMDEALKEILYDLANQYMEKQEFSKSLAILEQLYSEDANYKDLRKTIAKIKGNKDNVPTETMQDSNFNLFAAETLVDKAKAADGTSSPKKQRYEIIKEIGRGNMGIVCLAHDKELDEQVALKFLPQELRYDTMIVERFKQEVRSTRRLSHPHIVRIYDMGEETGRRYISMEYIDGKNLKDIVFEKKKFTPLEMIEIGVQVASALDYAHKMKVVHRDIKPANIMITNDNVLKVMDFGIASMMERAGLTQTGAMIGTPLYMSPEQAEGKHVDGRADIYSMGVMFYEFIAGKPPFYSGNISYQHVHVPPPPFEDPAIPKCITDIIMKCLAKNKDDRYQTAGECQKALEQCRENISTD